MDDKALEELKRIRDLCYDGQTRIALTFLILENDLPGRDHPGLDPAEDALHDRRVEI